MPDMDEPVKVEMDPEEALRLLLGVERRDDADQDDDEHDDDERKPAK